MMGEDHKTKPKILIIEDNQDFMNIATQMLSEYECYKSYTAHNGLELFKKHSPDVVFLDISLPDGSGHEVLLEIKNIDKDAFIVMLTGSQLKKDVLSSIEKGASDYIIKPFSRSKLKNAFDKYYSQLKV